MTASFKKIGFDNAVAVDKYKPAHPLASVVQMDLTKHEDQQVIFDWVKQPSTREVLLAPPCGTSSAARNIPLNEPNAPVPLRSLDEPDSIAGLTGSNLERVSAAIFLYQFVADTMDVCASLSTPCMVENPRSSLFWFTTPWVECRSALRYFFKTIRRVAMVRRGRSLLV